MSPGRFRATWGLRVCGGAPPLAASSRLPFSFPLLASPALPPVSVSCLIFPSHAFHTIYLKLYLISPSLHVQPLLQPLI